MHGGSCSLSFTKTSTTTAIVRSSKTHNNRVGASSSWWTCNNATLFHLMVILAVVLLLLFPAHGETADSTVSLNTYFGAKNESVLTTMIAQIYHTNDDDNDGNREYGNCTMWIHNVFGECVMNRLEMGGFWLGIGSVVVWVSSQIPQVVLNIRRQDASGLSGLFLGLFLMSDVLNVIASVFIYSIGTQLYSGIFYLIMDITLLLQWLFYKGKTMLKEQKLRRVMTSNSVGTMVKNYSDTNVGSRSLYFSPTRGNGMHTPNPNFGYAYYQSPSATGGSGAARDPRRGENESSLFSMYSETDSEVLTAYDTQEEDNFYQSKVDHQRAHDGTPLTSQATPVNNRSFMFLREQSFSNSEGSPFIGSGSQRKKSNQNRLYTFLPLSLLLCGVVIFVLLNNQQAGTKTMQSINVATNVRHVGGRSLLQATTENNVISEPIHQPPLYPIHSGLGIGGYVLGWIAAVLAIISRIPQISKNWTRKSTDGLSVMMFILAALGNFIFCVSIALNAAGSDIILSKLPWAVGALGSTLLDSVIVTQCWLYFEKTEINFE